MRSGETAMRPGDGEFLKKSQHQEHESPDTLEEISDGGGHDLAEFGQ